MDKYQEKWRLIIPIALLVLSLFDISTHAKANTGPPGILEAGLSDIMFDGPYFSGSTPHIGLSAAYPFHSKYEVGFTYSTNSFLFFPAFSVSLDEGRNLSASEDFETSVKMLYLRGDWPISKKITGFALVGLSKVKIKITSTQITCILFCGELISTSTNSTYSNKESGIAAGVGVQWKTKPDQFWSLKYIDYSDSDLDFTGAQLSRRIRF